MERRRMEYRRRRIKEIYDQRDNLKEIENLKLLD